MISPAIGGPAGLDGLRTLVHSRDQVEHARACAEAA